MIKTGAFCILLAFIVGCTAPLRLEPLQPHIEVKAETLTAGPYGQSWKLIYDGRGELEFQTNYMLSPMGRVSGSFFATQLYLDTLYNAINENAFYDLDANISPEVLRFHSPIFWLTISDGNRQHTVTLDDPNAIEDKEALQRFFNVWEAAFSLLPIKPEW